MTSDDEHGFTLIEVLVSVVIVSLLGGVMLAAMFVGLRNLDDTNKRLAGSNDTQLIAGYFTSDVASATAISTSGTKSHEAPSVTPTVANTALVSFWSFNRSSTVTVQSSMSQAWNVASASTRFHIAMANEATSAAVATGSRVATSSVPTSSITHSVALAPALLGTVTRRAYGSRTTAAAGATSLDVDKPSGIAQNDRLLAHVVVAGGPTTAVVAPGWTLVSSRDSGTAIKSLIFQKLATNADTTVLPPYTFSFMDKEGAGATAVVREAAIGIAAFSGVSTAVCAAPGPGCGLNTATLEANPCGGETPVLLLSWTDRHHEQADDVDIEVSYNATAVGTETHLIRRRCQAPAGTEISGTPRQEQTLASNLAPATAFASCASSTAPVPTSTTAPTATDFCAYLPVTITMSVTEPPGRDESSGRTYLMRASTRTDRESD